MINSDGKSSVRFKGPGLIMLFCGIALLALGGIVILGWHANYPGLIQVRPDYAAMQYTTAAAFLLSGIALMLLVARRGRGAMFLGMIVGFVGFWLSLEYLFGVKLGFDSILAVLPSLLDKPPLRPSPPASICFAFCGVALAVLGSNISETIKRPVIWVVGSFTLSLTIMVLCGYFTGLAAAYAWGRFIGMAIHTAGGMGILSIGLLATQFRESKKKPVWQDPWLPVPVAVATATAMVILWQALVVDQDKRIILSTAIAVENIKIHFSDHLHSRLRALNRMAFRWNQRGGTPYEEWRADAFHYLADEEGLIAIACVDSALHLRWMVPEDAGAEFLEPGLTKEIRRKLADRSANTREKAEMFIESVVTQKREDGGFLACSSLFSKEKFDGLIIGMFQDRVVLDAVFAERNITDYSLAVFEGGDQIYGRPFEQNSGDGIHAESTAVFFDHALRLVLTPTPKFLSQSRSALPHLILALGLILSAALAVAALALQRVKMQSLSAAIANRELQEKIAERTKMEARLRESEERLSIVLASATGVSVISATSDGMITYFSKGAEKLLGYTSDEMVGKTTPAIFHDENEVKLRGEELSRELGRKIEGFAVFVTKPRMDGRERREWSYICKDGTRKTVELTVTELRNASGFVGTAIDITERKQLEKSLHTATAQAQSYAKAKAEFLANMSHEIRTPLNAIIGMSELLFEGAKDENQKEFIETIRTSGDALLGLINDILDFSKIESGQLGMERIPVDLHECVESALDLVSAQASEKKLDLLYWIDPSVPTFILGDITRLRQVIVNLVMNGVKFTGRGEIFVRISKVVGDSGKELLHFSVRDTGIGIPAERQNRLFHAFSQVDASTTRRYGGTGLGLAICARLIDIMQGRIWVESEPGKGADFQFEIPLEPAAVMIPKIYQKSSHNELQGLRVLIVDDNETNRWILQAQAASWGMQPYVTGQPSEALRKVESGDPFDLAILDAEMPEMDGYELSEKLREHHTSQKMQILILTSKADTKHDFEKLGINAHLTKPIKATALYDAVTNLLLGRRVSRLPEQKKEESLLAENCPMRILVAEDNPVNQRVTMLLLQRLGYRSEVVANGLEVIEAVQRMPFDVILLDVQMPEMDGLQAARELCHLYSLPQRPYMIALTADASESDKDTCLSAGMDDYLSKPVRSNILADALCRAFAERKKLNPSG